MKPYDLEDYASEMDIRWCPGCGDFAILKAVQKMCHAKQYDPDQLIFVSGIGCSSRFPYYMGAYGFHTLHGRAPCFATGLYLSSQGLRIWIITGDGDGLSIGGNHLLHVCRRDLDMNILLFNNEIYGLTKGQASATSSRGLKTVTTPQGVQVSPVIPILFALSSGASFVARSGDRLQKHLLEILHQADEHCGLSFVEILQNCIIYNDGFFDHLVSKEAKSKGDVIFLDHGNPLIFGEDPGRGLVFNAHSLSFDILDLSCEEDRFNVTIHDKTNKMLAYALIEMGKNKNYPVPFGVFYEGQPKNFSTNSVGDREERQKNFKKYL